MIRLGALGDVVRTRFAFAGVRALFPKARIDWLVEDRAAAGLVGLPGLSELVQVPRRRLRARHPLVAFAALREFSAELRARRYDLSIDFHGVFRSAFLAWSAGIPARVGYAAPIAKEASHWLQTLSAPVPSSHMSRFERNAALVRFLGGEIPERPAVLELDPARGRMFGELPARFALVHPGTSPKTGYKRWEADRFAALARGLHERARVESVERRGRARARDRVARGLSGPARARKPVRRLRLGAHAPGGAGGNARGGDLRAHRPDRKRPERVRAQPHRAPRRGLQSVSRGLSRAGLHARGRTRGGDRGGARVALAPGTRYLGRRGIARSLSTKWA